MKITVDVWFVAEDGTLPVTKVYSLPDDTDNKDFAALDKVLSDADFTDKVGITIKLREDTY